MMTTRLINGARVALSPAEDAAFAAERARDAQNAAARQAARKIRDEDSSTRPDVDRLLRIIADLTGTPTATVRAMFADEVRADRGRP